MNTSFKEFIVIICVLLYVSKGIKHVDRDCRTEDHKCCDNYYKLNENCIECKLGYHRTAVQDDGFCRQCPYPSFGKKCLNACNCSKHQRCDHVTGCVTLDINERNNTSQDKAKDATKMDLAAIVVVPIIFIIIVPLLVFRKRFKRYYQKYQDYKREHNEQASVLTSFICHSMKKCRSYKTESNELDQSKDENVENHYCDIDESAMIKTLNSSEKPCDMYHGIAVDGEYNHLKMNACSDSDVPNTYSGNVYTKMKDTGKCGRINDNTLPQYDRIDEDGNIVN